METQTRVGDDVRKIGELIKEIDFGMLTTRDKNGKLHSRPMSTNGEVEFDGDVWFFTDTDSPKVTEIEESPEVNVTFSDPKSMTYVSMAGTAEIIRDRQKIQELWLPSLQAWFPKGKEDPNIALIKVCASEVEYWDAPHCFFSNVAGMAKAAITGERPEYGENEKVTLA